MRRSLTIVCVLILVSLNASPIRSAAGLRHLAMTTGDDHESYSAKDYVQEGLIAMWDGEWNAGAGIHDANATKLYELISDQIDYGVASTFVANVDNMEVSVANNSVATPSPFAEAVAKAVSEGYVHIEGVVFIDAAESQIYGNSLTLCDGSFGWQFRSGRGGLYMFSSGWVVVIDPNTISANKVRIAIDIDAVNETVTYHVGAQSSQPKGISVPQALQPSAKVSWVGNKIFNLRAYSRPLSADEINANYTIDWKRFGL